MSSRLSNRQRHLDTSTLGTLRRFRERLNLGLGNIRTLQKRELTRVLQDQLTLLAPSVTTTLELVELEIERLAGEENRNG